MPSLPNVGGDNGIWGGELNTWLTTGHNADGTHPAPPDAQPAGNGFLAWNADSALQGGSTFTATAGTLYLVGLTIPALTITDVCFYTYGSGSGAAANQNYAGIYNSAGSRVAASSAGAADFIAGNGFAFAPVPLSSSYAAAAGFYWFALLLNASALPPMIALGSGDAFIASVNLAVSAARFAVNGTGLTSLPSSITPGSNALSGAHTWWVALK